MLKRVLLKRLHPSWAIVWLMVGVVAGDILVLVTRWNFASEVIWLVLAGLLLIASILVPQRGLMLLALVAGVILVAYRASADLAGQESWEALTGQTTVISGTVAKDPATSASSTSYQLKNLSVDGVEIAGSIYISGGVNRDLARGDRVEVRGKLVAGFGTFAGAMYRPTLLSITKPDPPDPFLAVRNWFAERVRQFIPEPESALGIGYLLGDRSGLPSDLDTALRVVGLTHIIVTSGTHLSILVGFSRKFLGKLSRFAALFASVLLVLFMMGLVGMTPSIVRAGLVSLLSLGAWYVGRKFQPLRLILLVAGLTLLYHPMYLIDLAWLLSFGSFIGVMVVSPRLAQFFYGDKEPGLIAGTVISSLAASIICTPILLYFFGTMSLISLVANVLILPTIPWEMGLTFATGLVGFTGIGKVAQLLLKYHLLVIEFLGQQEMFLIEIPAGNPLVFWLYLPVVLVALAAIKHNIKVGKGNAGHQNGPAKRIDGGKNVV